MMVSQNNFKYFNSKVNTLVILIKQTLKIRYINKIKCPQQFLVNKINIY